MKLHHIAIWVDDIDKMRNFYTTYFDTTCGEKYYNPKRGYTSYFISFDEGSSKIELMHQSDIETCTEKRGFIKGWAHIAISVKDKKTIDQMTERFRKDGYTIQGEPRTTGDGYYESVILDPEGNLVEIVY